MAALLALALVPTTGSGMAAKPARGTLARVEQQVRWHGQFADRVHPPTPAACTEMTCDEFELTVALPSTVWVAPGGVQIGIRWPDEAQDLDLYVYDEAGTLVAQSDGFFASTAESVLLRLAENGTYRVVVVPRYAEDLVYKGIAEVERLPADEPVRALLPDLRSLPSRNFHFATGGYLFDPGVSVSSCYPEEVAEEGARRCLRFDQIIANFGDGPFELRYRMDGLATDQQLRQRIYFTDGSFEDRVADTYEFHAAHGHFHYKNFAQSMLWASNKDGAKLGKKPVRVGDKNGFCMIDVANEWFGRKGDASRTYYFPRCNSPTESEAGGVYMVNGISVGWADVYNWYLADQYIEVSDLEDGYYVLATRADPEDTIEEIDERDNDSSVHIQMCGDNVEVVGSKTKPC
jgi:hypothetical protein